MCGVHEFSGLRPEVAVMDPERSEGVRWLESLRRHAIPRAFGHPPHLSNSLNS